MASVDKAAPLLESTIDSSAALPRQDAEAANAPLQLRSQARRHTDGHDVRRLSLHLTYRLELQRLRKSYRLAAAIITISAATGAALIVQGRPELALTAVGIAAIGVWRL